MAPNLCQFAKTCPVYKGQTSINETPLPVYKNVFCYRGIKGWNNCDQFIEFNKQKIDK